MRGRVEAGRCGCMLRGSYFIIEWYAKKVLHKEGVFRAEARDECDRPLHFGRGNRGLRKSVGRGSFGVVYRAKMKQYPYSTRAVKRIKKKYVKSPSDFLKEFLILTTLDHPQIIKIY